MNTTSYRLFLAIIACLFCIMMATVSGGHSSSAPLNRMILTADNDDDSKLARYTQVIIKSEKPLVYSGLLAALVPIIAASCGTTPIALRSYENSTDNTRQVFIFSEFDTDKCDNDKFRSSVEALGIDDVKDPAYLTAVYPESCFTDNKCNAQDAKCPLCANLKECTDGKQCGTGICTELTLDPDDDGNDEFSSDKKYCQNATIYNIIGSIICIFSAVVAISIF